MRRLVYCLLSTLRLNAIYTCSLLGLLILVSFNIATAQQTSSVVPTQQGAGDKAQTSKLSATETKKDYSKEPYVIERSRIAYRFENDGTGQREISIRVRVQSEAGVKGLGQLRFGYNSASEKLEIPYVRVIKPDGSVITAGADAVQELNEPIQRTVYTDFHEKHVIVPGLRPGDVLECQTIATIHTPMAPGQFWMQHDFQKKAIVLDEQLEVDIPAARTVKLKTKPGFDPKITESNGRRIYNWSTSNLSREEDEAKSDASQEKKKKKKRPEDDIPSVQLTSFSSWAEVGHWYAGLEKDRRVPSAAVRAKADELTKGLQTDIEKIQALYDYTARNFRYVSLSLGMGHYQPHSADEVLHNQYGDCKDKNTLLVSLLEAEGFHASSVLINFGRKLDTDVPSPAQFNHVITMLPLGKDEIWMDTTAEVAPFRLLLYPLRKKQSLVIAPDGAHLEETPADSPVPDSEIVKIDGKIDDTGKLDANITYEMRGDLEVRWRQVFRSAASAQWQQIVEQMSSREGMGKDVSEVKASDPSATRESFKFSYRLVKASYLDQSKNKLGLKLPLYGLGLATADPDDADGPDPIKLGAPHTHDYNIRLELPVKYTVRSLLPISLKRDYGNYEAVYKLEKNVFTAERKLIVGQSELPSSRVQDYLAFRRSVSDDSAQQLSLETTVASRIDVPADIKPADLLKRGDDAAKNGNYALAIDLFKRAVDADPKTNMGWNNLGLAYLNSRQYEQAAKSFQKQIEINGYHPYAYNNLGLVYLRQRNYEEAIKWFNKQIEIDPLDKYAHGNLGLAYMEQEKYVEAVPELEKAASLTPDNAEAQVRLGEAYLNAAQDEKAMTAFDNALKISTQPLIWNNIAYQLARKKVHMDVARRYADSAVTSTAAALRTLSLDQLSSRNVGLTASLANYWDTLGWIDYADGNLAAAQKYIEAAWQLNQHSEVGDHLGQIFEKEGEKKKALDQYVLAMNARRPDAALRSRLNTLAGGSEKANALIGKSKTYLLEQRTLKLHNTAKQDGKADFFLLLAKKSGPTASIDSVKFISGDEKLKDFAETLRSVSYSVPLPDETEIRLLLRGTLSCIAAKADCSFVLLSPDDLRSID